MLSGDDCTALLAWEPGQQARGGAGGGGRRDTRNGRRAFITPALRHARPDLDRLAARFDDRGMRRLIAARTGARLGGTALRMELCFDTEGFWLEPHTDIGAKRLTLLIGLSTDHRAEGWGTDLMTPDGQVVKRASGRFNNGLMFVPGRDTWHGFAARRIEGERRTLIVNFVDRSWQSREELA
ncbi:hypothetical protein AA103196_0772 [Ameyamaea chiangmaiensis NBRC 103196]|nr:hypothetical protein AA103196_0772 [Ameyamaea chiangmaiensis NBRC 103196]